MSDDAHQTIADASAEAISRKLRKHVAVFCLLIISVTAACSTLLSFWSQSAVDQVNQLNRITSVRDMLPVVSMQSRTKDVAHNESNRQQLLADIDKLEVNIQGIKDVAPNVNQAFKQTIAYWDTTSKNNLELHQASTNFASAISDLRDTIAAEPPSTSSLQIALTLEEVPTANLSATLAKLSDNASLAVQQRLDAVKEAQEQLQTIIDSIEKSHEANVFKGITAIEDLNLALNNADISVRQQITNNENKINALAWALLALVSGLAMLFMNHFKKLMANQLAPYTNVINSARHIRHSNILLENQIRRKRSFLSVVSYESRTLLGSIMGSASQALSHAKDPQAQGYLTEVVSSGTHLENILDDVMTMIDTESDQLVLDDRVFNIHYMLKSLKQHYTKLCDDKGLTFTLRADKSINKLYAGDVKRLRHVLESLLNSSVQFTDSGNVEFEVDVDAASSNGAMQRLNFTISDSGAPVPTTEHLTYFEPYERSFGSSRGSNGYSIQTGLAAQLIKKMGGDIQIVSDDNKGLTISFYLMLNLAAPGAEEMPIEEQALAAELPDTINFKRALNILVVEDNETNAQLLQWMLEDMDHRVTIAENGVACLNLLDNHKFDLIFMDQYMPEMDGAEATRKIRARSDDKATIPIIGCTADGFQETKELLSAAGQNDIIVKPVAVGEVISVMQRFATGKFKTNKVTQPE